MSSESATADRFFLPIPELTNVILRFNVIAIVLDIGAASVTVHGPSILPIIGLMCSIIVQLYSRIDGILVIPQAHPRETEIMHDNFSSVEEFRTEIRRFNSMMRSIVALDRRVHYVSLIYLTGEFEHGQNGYELNERGVLAYFDTVRNFIYDRLQI